MKQLLRATVATTAFLMLVASSLLPSHATAQSDHQPGVIVSIAKIKEQLDDIGYLLDSSGYGQLKFMINIQAKEFLKGVDLERPAGALLYFSDDKIEPDVVGFLPVSNLDDLLGAIGEMGMGDIDEGDDGVIALTLGNGTELFAKEKDGFVFVSNIAENLEELPLDPLSMVGNLPTDYNLAARAFGDRIPENTRQFFMGLIRDGFEKQLEQTDSDEDETESQRATMELQMKQIEDFFNETEEVEFGLNIAKDSNSMLIDLRLVGKDGSKFAKQIESSRNHKSRFGGFLMKDSAFHGISHSILSPEDQPAMDKVFDDLQKQITGKLADNEDLSDEERAAVESLATTLIDTIKTTAKNGTLDLGIVGKTDGTQLNIGLAFESADPRALEAEIKKIVPLAERRADDKLEVKLDAFQLLNANFHEFKIAVPESEEEARKIFGDQATLIAGFGKDVAYLGVGAGSADLIKQAMEASATSSASAELPMTEFNVFLSPILEMAAAVQDDTTLTKMAEKLKENGRDRITIVGKAIENGMLTRFEIQDGFLQLIQIAQEQFGGPPARDF